MKTAARRRATPRTPAAARGLAPGPAPTQQGPRTEAPTPVERTHAATERSQPAVSIKPQAEPDAGFVAVGRVLGPFGLKGELKAQALTDNADRFKVKAKLFAGQQPVTIAKCREAAGQLYLTFKGFADRDSVDKFRHALLQVPESDLPALPEGEYYRFQLIGLTVTDRTGAALGTLDEIIETGANDVYRVHPAEGTDLLLPALADVIISVDLEAKRMVVDPPDWR